MLYEVLLGVDHAARDTGQRVIVDCLAPDPLTAGESAEALLDAELDTPFQYSHAMRATPITREAAAVFAA